MPDDNSGTGNEANNGGYGGTGDGFGGGDPGFGGASQATAMDAAAVGATVAGIGMIGAGFIGGSPALGSIGLGTAGIGMQGLDKAVSDFNNTNGSIGPGPNSLGGLDINAAGSVSMADLSVASSGPGVTDYFNGAGQLVGSTFDQVAYAQWIITTETGPTGVG